MEGANRLRKNYVGTLEFLGSTRVAQQQSGHAGCSKRSAFSPAQHQRAKTRLVPSKAAGESKPEAYPLGYVEDFDESRTTLTDFFSILLESG